MIAGIERFKEITGYDIQAFFQRYINFVQNDYQNIVDYYNGSNMVPSSFNELDNLLAEVGRIESLFELNVDNFNTIDFWEIVVNYDEVQTKLLTCKKMGKWNRSSRTNRFDGNIKIERGLKQFETFEKISGATGSVDQDNDWTGITVDNLIVEEGYTSEGGTIFTVKLLNNANFNILNIVDNLIDDNIYGKDIDRNINFVNNDLVVKQFNEAVKQSFEVKLATVKGSIPEFPERGIEADSSSNVNTIQYPSIFRNILNLFQSDGRWSEVNLIDLSRDQDAVFMKLEAKTVLKDSFITNINI